jgi:hypothetical protein
MSKNLDYNKGCAKKEKVMVDLDKLIKLVPELGDQRNKINPPFPTQGSNTFFIDVQNSTGILSNISCLNLNGVDISALRFFSSSCGIKY